MSMLLSLSALTLTSSLAHAGTDDAAPVRGDGASASVSTPVDPVATEGAQAEETDGPAVAEGPPEGGGAPPDGRHRRRRPGRGHGEGGPHGGPPGEGPRGPFAHMRPVALVQIWGTVYDMDADPVADSTGYGDPEDDPGFSLKRARLGLAGADDGLDWALVVGVTDAYDGFDDEDGSIEIVDAHVGYEKKGIGISVGHGELPFSRDQMIGSGEQTFEERGLLAEHIAPPRSMGATVWGGRWGLKATLGVYNSGGELFGDDNLGKTFLGRVEFAHGDADVYETWGGSKKLSLGVGAGGFMTDDVATRTRSLGADAILRVSGLTVLVDAAMGDVAPTDTDLDVPGVWEQTTRRALTGQIGYGIGPVEPAVKMSVFDDSALGTYTVGMFGVVWHGLMEDHRDRVRIGAGYVLRLEDGNFPNDSVRVWAQLRP